MVMKRRSFFAWLFAPLVARFAPKARAVTTAKPTAYRYRYSFVNSVTGEKSVTPWIPGSLPVGHRTVVRYLEDPKKLEFKYKVIP
jgi:hypothetical protein